MNVFLDTNVLLGLYRLSGPDLEEVRRLIKLADAKKLTVCINSNVVEEFTRNREKVIAESLKHLEIFFKKEGIPNLCKPYAEGATLREAVAHVEKTAKSLRDAVRKDAEEHTLKADSVIAEVFAKFKPVTIGDGVIEKARARREFGNPPGKQSKLGDAINWEWLLETTPKGEDLHIISADGDYESELMEGEMRDFLWGEFNVRKDSSVFLYKSLLGYLQKCFPEFKLADEVEKVLAVQRLLESFSFSETHAAIKSLTEYQEFTQEQVAKMLNAIENNSQIGWILSDEDVTSFAKKLIALAKSDEAKEAAETVRASLNAQVEKAKKISTGFVGGDDDDDIPF